MCLLSDYFPVASTSCATIFQTPMNVAFLLQLIEFPPSIYGHGHDTSAIQREGLIE
jgi:hypothetical protein